MATLYISEFGGVSTIGTTLAQVLPQPSLADQVVAISGVSAASVPFGPRTKTVLLVADEACSIAFAAADPVALVTNMRIPADTPMPFAVPSNYQVAVIANP